MKKYTVRFSDQRDPPQRELEEIEVEAEDEEDARERASALFFTRHDDESPDDYLITCTETIISSD